MRRLAPLICIIAVAFACGSQNDESRAHSIEAQVWSPYCPGRLLIDCTTRQARELRGDIASRVDRGEETDEILAWIRNEFGPSAIAKPTGGTSGLVIWLVPAAIFIAGAVLVARAIRKWRPVAANR